MESEGKTTEPRELRAPAPKPTPDPCPQASPRPRPPLAPTIGSPAHLASEDLHRLQRTLGRHGCGRSQELLTARRRNRKRKTRGHPGCFSGSAQARCAQLRDRRELYGSWAGLWIGGGKVGPESGGGGTRERKGRGLKGVGGRQRRVRTSRNSHPWSSLVIASSHLHLGSLITSLRSHTQAIITLFEGDLCYCFIIGNLLHL